LLARLPRLALNQAMLLAFVSSVLVVITTGDVLPRSSSRGPYEAAWPLSLGTARLGLDGLSAWFLITIGVLSACVSIYSVPYMSSAVGREPVPVFCALFCALLASLILLVCAADAVLFLISWEAMTLTALRRGSIQVRLLFIVLFLCEALSSVGRVHTTTGQDYQHTLSVGVDR
jgi:formate hydrogenlyase subunit 3/multisubunit Na+/H+ antiporter MnhD subunit